MSDSSDTLDVLLVGEPQDYLRSLEDAFESLERPSRLHVVESGEDALDWLHHREEFEDSPRPDLLLVDLDLPADGGMTFLEAVKSDVRLRRLPVVAMTSSPTTAELGAAYDHRVNACLCKPDAPEEFATFVDALTGFWAGTAELPIFYDEETA